MLKKGYRKLIYNKKVIKKNQQNEIQLKILKYLQNNQNINKTVNIIASHNVWKKKKKNITNVCLITGRCKSVYNFLGWKRHTILKKLKKNQISSLKTIGW